MGRHLWFGLGFIDLHVIGVGVVVGADLLVDIE
jgi:hypothetical protein